MEDNKPHILTIMASLGTFVFLAGSLISGLILCYSLIEILLPEIDSFQVSGFEYGFGIFFALSNATAFFIVFFPLYIYSSRYMQRAIKRQLQVGKVIEIIQNIVIAIIIAISILIVAVSAVIFNNRIFKYWVTDHIPFENFYHDIYCCTDIYILQSTLEKRF